MAQRQMDLIIRWLERNPEAAKSVLKKMNDLRDAQTETVKVGKDIFKMTSVGMKQAKKDDKSKKNQGMRWSWLGYRIMAMGRILQRWVLIPFRATISILDNLEEALASAAFGMAMAEEYGSDLGETLEDFKKDAVDAVDASLNLKQAFGEWDIFILQVSSDLADPLGNKIRWITDLLKGFWEWLMKALGPEATANILVGLAAFTGALIAFGTALFFVKPVLTALGPLFALLKGHVALLNPILLALAAIVLTVKLHWEELKNYWNSHVAPAINFLKEAFTGLIERLFGSEVALKALEFITTPVKLALEAIMFWVSALIAGFAALIEILNRIIDVFTGFGRVVSGIFQGLSERVGNFIDSIKGLGNWVDKIFGHSIGKDIAADLGKATEAFKSIGMAMGAGATFAGGAAPMQYITVYSTPTLNIESVSGEVDLAAIQDAIDRGIGNSLRRMIAPKW